MSTSDGGIHRHRPVDDSGSLSSRQQPGQHRIPNALGAHPAMPCPDRLPRPEDRRHITPSDPTPIAIDNSFDHLAGITKRPALLASTYRQQILDQQPLGIRQHLKPRHTLSLRHNTPNICQTRPSGASPQPAQACGGGSAVLVGSDRRVCEGPAVLVMSRSRRWLALRPTRRSELVMTLPRSVSDVLDKHVQFEIESIDRMYLNIYVPELQRAGQVAGFLMRHHGFPIASTALVAPMSRQFVTDIKTYAADRGIPLVHFTKGQRKDDVMHQHLTGFSGTDEIMFIGVAQEKAHVFRTERRHNPTTGAPYPWIVTTTAVVSHYYFYGVDDDFGPFFFKFCSYFPYTARLCINGNEYAKRQAAKAGIGFEALDNGFAAVADTEAVQAI